MKRFILIIFSLPFVLISQNERNFFVETGTCFNVIGTKKFTIDDGNSGSTTRYNWSGSIISSPSYFIKLGGEKVFKLCPKSEISFPVSISYFDVKETIDMLGYTSGCFVSEYGHKIIKQNDHTIGVSAGLKFTSKPTEKISIQNGINISEQTIVYSTTDYKMIQESGTYSSHDANGPSKISLALSVQSGIFYQINSKTKLGLIGEYFFYNKQLVPHYNRHLMDDYAYGYKGYSAMLNLGLRLQHSF